MDSSGVFYVSLNDSERCYLCILLSAISLISLATGAFISGIYTYNPILVIAMTSAGLVSFTLLYLIMGLIIKKTRTKTKIVQLQGFRSKTISLKTGIQLAIYGGISFGLGLDFMFLGYFYEPQSRGVISSIVTLYLLIYAIYSCYLGNLKLYWTSGIAALLALAGLLLIFIYSIFDNLWHAYLYGFIAMIFMTGAAVCAYYSKKSSLELHIINILYAFMAFAVNFIFILVIKYILGVEIWTSEDSLFWPFFGGVLLGIGIFINQDYIQKDVLLASALPSLFGMLQILIEFLYWNLAPYFVYTIGASIISGAMLIFNLGKPIADFIESLRENSKNPKYYERSTF